MNILAFVAGIVLMVLGIWSIANPSYEKKIYANNYPKFLIGLNPSYTSERRIKMTGVFLILIGLLLILASFI